MHCLCGKKLSFRLSNGDTLFHDLDVNLEQKITALVGRNGVGKSILAAVLAGVKPPYSGTVERHCSLGFLQQVDITEQRFQQHSIASFLGMDAVLAALERVAAGQCHTEDFNLIGDQWLLQDKLKERLRSLQLPTDPQLACTALSGGQLTRLALDHLFQSHYGYLILDEPSNHLDAQGKAWLLDQMRAFSGGILLISHDRSLLRQVEDTLELTTLGLRYYGCAYDDYAAQRAAALASQIQHLEQAKKQIKQLQHNLQKNREKAERKAQQGKKYAQSGSQAKVLLGAQKQNAQRTVGNSEQQKNRQLEQVAQKRAELIEQQERIKPQQLTLVNTEKRGSKLLNLIAVQLPFGTREPMTLSVNFGDKIHLLGPNGSGKSTLLKIIVGRVKPLSGTVQSKATLCYLDQHFSLLQADQSALHNLLQACPHLSETTARTLLAGIGLRRDKANQAVATLSGGEKMKVAMLIVSHQLGDTLLLLDEPDNHLDLDARQLLSSALAAFNGAVILVSHDSDFVADIGNLLTLTLTSA